MNFLEFKEHLYNASIQATTKDVKHFRVGGEKNGIRKYQNLDGSLTPLGRIHYGVGMSREEMRAEREAEDSRQRAIDYNRSKSIREMDNYELSEAINRSRDEMVFEKNMQNRAENFLRSRNLEEELNQEYEQMLYNKSQLKAERFMAKAERIGRFVGNLAGSYGKIVDVKEKIENVRWKAGMADQEMWKAEKNRLDYEDTAYWKSRKREKYEREEYEPWKRQMDERDAKLKSDAKAAAKQAKLDAKQAKKEAKEAKKAGDPAYVRKEGDTYIYDDSTKSKWQSFKDKLKEKKEAKAQKNYNKEMSKKEAEAEKFAKKNGVDYNQANKGYNDYMYDMARKEQKAEYDARRYELERDYGQAKYNAGMSSKEKRSDSWASNYNKESSKKSEPSLNAPKAPTSKKATGLTELGKAISKGKGKTLQTTSKNLDQYINQKDTRKKSAKLKEQIEGKSYGKSESWLDTIRKRIKSKKNKR